MVGEILSFLHRHVRIATPLVLVLAALALWGVWSMVGWILKSLIG